MSHVPVSTAAGILGCKPRAISDLLYHQSIGNDFPIIGGRKYIPVDRLPEIEAALRRAGKLK